jgi:hypothetical protein
MCLDSVLTAGFKVRRASISRGMLWWDMLGITAEIRPTGLGGVDEGIRICRHGRLSIIRSDGGAGVISMNSTGPTSSRGHQAEQ